MDRHTKKKIAPAVIAVIYFLYFSLCVFILVNLISKPWEALLLLLPFASLGLVIYVLIQRFNEIDGGEEDDLSKY